MTVNERLFAAGLLAAFDDAVAAGDEHRLRKVLAEVFLTGKDADAVVASVLRLTESGNPYQPPRAPLTSHVARAAQSRRAYSPGQVAGAVFLGSPIAGCILLASNFSTFGAPERGRQAIVWGLLSTVAVVGLALVIPEDLPSSVLPIAYTVALHQIAKRVQGDEFKRHIDAGGGKYSHWRVVGIGLICSVALFVVIVGALMAFPPDPVSKG